MKAQKVNDKSIYRLILYAFKLCVLLVFTSAMLSEPAFGWDPPSENCPDEKEIGDYCKNAFPEQVSKWQEILNNWEKIYYQKELIFGRCSPDYAERAMKIGLTLRSGEKVYIKDKFTDKKTGDVFLILNREQYKQLLIEVPKKSDTWKRNRYRRAKEHTQYYAQLIINKCKVRSEYWQSMYVKCCTGGWKENPPTTTREPPPEQEVFIDPREDGLMGIK